MLPIIKNYSILLAILMILLSCKKSGGGDNGGGTTPPVNPPVVITPQTDPALANTIGFFIDDWEPRTFPIPATSNPVTAPTASTYVVNVDYSKVITKIPRSIFGNNINTWMTQVLNESVLMDYLTKLRVPIIRFPGGSISDIFFWNALPNQAPGDAPNALLNATGTAISPGYWFGKNSASWTLSLDNYYSILQQVGSKGIITVNYGYARYGTGTNPVAAAAHLAADWVRYDNGRTKYWEIGNENFGDWEAGYRIDLANNKDGQPEYLSGFVYGQHFKVFADSMRKAANEIGKNIHIGAVMVEAETPSWGTSTHRSWNTGLLSAAGSSPDFYVVHSYYTPYNTNSNANDILNSAITETGKIMSFVKQAFQTAGLPEKPVVLDEWNINAVGSKQQVSHVNGLHADLILGELIKNKFGMSARWDLANGWDNGNDHGMFNNGDEPDAVPKWNARPAFYHMYFFQRFLGDRMIQAEMTGVTDMAAYASSFTSGEMGITLVNKANTARTVEIDVKNFLKGDKFYWYTLTGGTDNGEFSRKVEINGIATTLAAGGTSNYHSISPNSASAAGPIRVIVPARAAVFMAIDNQ